ncbi:sensor histidine kinase [Brevibacillus sp. B_LB10_24]|uniref:cache domain-containing sensor histidine kinase n=1 Tax=Brevibacillus sp. B_LB10_24 TaxID=3380645 RepID=UPI0038BBF0F1
MNILADPFRKSIKLRLMFFFIIVSILPIVLVGLIPYQKSQKVVEQQVLEYAQGAIDQLNQNISYHLQEMDLMSRMIYYQIFSLFHQEKWQKETQLLLDRDQTDSLHGELKNFLMALKNNRTFIDEIHLIIGEEVFTTAIDLDLDALRQQEWYQRAVNKPDEKTWTGPHQVNYYVNNPSPDEVLSLVHSFHLSHSTQTATIMIEMKAETLQSLFDSPNRKSLGSLLLIDKYGRIIYESDGTQRDGSGQQYITNTSLLRTLGKENNFIYAMNFINGWKVAAFIPNDKIAHSFQSIKETVFVLLGVFLMIAIVLGWTLSDRFIKPLKVLQRDMSRVQEGDFQIRTRIDSRDEIGDLSHSFNQMVTEIERLIGQISENERKKKEMELQSLQYQINPHFLYNTLNSVQWLARLHDVPQISEMLTCLIKLLRESLKSTGELHQLGEELGLLNDYVMIQKYRYEGNVDIRYYIDPDLLQCLVPRFILQPLVENSFFHAFSNRKGKISISAHRLDVQVEIIIEDDGKGIDPHVLNHILHTPDKGKTSSGIGIKNVHEKIRLYFEDPYGLTISSEVGKGTTILITLPYITKTERGRNDETSAAS